VPLGVWLCREETRQALAQIPKTFDNLRSALGYVGSKLQFPLSRFIETSTLLKDMRSYKQTVLTKY